MVVRSPGFRPQGPLGALLGWLFLGRSRYPERRRTVKNSSLLDSARTDQVQRRAAAALAMMRGTIASAWSNDSFAGRTRSAMRFESTRAMATLEQLAEYRLQGIQVEARTAAFLAEGFERAGWQVEQLEM